MLAPCAILLPPGAAESGIHFRWFGAPRRHIGARQRLNLNEKNQERWTILPKELQISPCGERGVLARYEKRSARVTVARLATLGYRVPI